MRQIWPNIFVGVAMLGGAAVGVYLMRNRIPLSPRQARRTNLWTSALVAVPMLLLAGMNWANGQYMAASLVGLIALCCLAGLLTSYLRTPPPIEAQQNFAVDPGRCGRCEYDLTGNTSGICPECGWEIPRGAPDVDSPGWALWWRKWEIQHLRDCRRTLLFLIAMILVFVATAATTAVLLGPMTIVMPALMSANFGINLWRVAAYARRSV